MGTWPGSATRTTAGSEPPPRAVLPAGALPSSSAAALRQAPAAGRTAPQQARRSRLNDGVRRGRRFRSHRSRGPAEDGHWAQTYIPSVAVCDAKLCSHTAAVGYGRTAE